MNLSTLDIFAIAIYLLIVLGIGVYQAMKTRALYHPVWDAPKRIRIEMISLGRDLARVSPPPLPSRFKFLRLRAKHRDKAQCLANGADAVKMRETIGVFDFLAVEHSA